jgi:hypothetical protein
VLTFQSAVTSVTGLRYKFGIFRELLLGHYSRTFNRFFTRLQRKLGEDLLCADRQAYVIGGETFGPARRNFPGFRDLRAS